MNLHKGLIARNRRRISLVDLSHRIVGEQVQRARQWLASDHYVPAADRWVDALPEALADLRGRVEAAVADTEIPKSPPARLFPWDLRPGNALYDDGVTAILDWGEPLAADPALSAAKVEHLVCDWYVEFAKPLLASDDPGVVAETRATMAWVLDRCLILLHPFMPFITEELWGLTAPAGGRAGPLILADWPDELQATDLADEKADAEMGWVIGLIEEIRSVRAQMGVPAGTYLPLLQVELDAAGRQAWARNETLIKRLARIESLSEVSEPPKGAVTVPVEGGVFALPLSGVIDIDKERARLEKALDKLDKDISGLRGRLDNPKFLESAPEHVVDESRELLAHKEDEAAKLRAALGRVRELA